MKRLEILHTDPVGLIRSHDIDKFLANFCAWQRDENPHSDSDPLHWDHALILTGLDLYVVSKNGKLSRQVVGGFKFRFYSIYLINAQSDFNAYFKFRLVEISCRLEEPGRKVHKVQAHDFKADCITA